MSKQEFLTNVNGQTRERRPEDYLVKALMDFDDVSYDDHADLLYDLAGQLVAHLKGYLSDDDALNVLQYHQRQLGGVIHTQMQAHRWEKATDYRAEVSKGFSALKPNAYTASTKEGTQDFRRVPEPLGEIRKHVFGGFKKCLYDVQKFDVNPERIFAVVLEDDADVRKWFKPARGQFQIYHSKDHAYEPGFVVETTAGLFLCEPKRRKALADTDVLAKKTATLEWCRPANAHAEQHGGKRWTYLLIPDDIIKVNMTLAGLTSQTC